MAITDLTTVVGVTPRLSQEAFARILRDAGSPAALEADPDHGWSMVQQHGVDPAFALAIFHQESQFARDPGSAVVLHALRNPGHTRTSRTGVGVTVGTQWGNFIRYPSWSEGWRDLAFRLVDPNFAYVQGLPHKPPGPGPHRTIRPIIAIWAPEDDPNAPPGMNVTEVYIAHVVENMTRWVDLPAGGQPTTVVNPACAPSAPPPFDGADKQIGAVTFHAAAQTITVVQDGLPCRQFADPATCETRAPLRQGETFEALYWIEGEEVAGERRWWVAQSGSRIWSGGTSPRPAQPN
jgi:hypothetical protein